MRPNNETLVEAVKDSPVLAREHIYDQIKDEAWEKDPITVEGASNPSFSIVIYHVPAAFTLTRSHA